MELYELVSFIHSSGNIRILRNYFIDKESLNDFKQSISEKISTPNNGFYDDAKDVTFEEDIVTYDDVKCYISIDNYQELFGTTILPNNRLYPEDLRSGMWVWNHTQGRYQKLRYISKKSNGGKYYYCDDWGHIVEDDELYRYKPDEVDEY